MTMVFLDGNQTIALVQSHYYTTYSRAGLALTFITFKAEVQEEEHCLETSCLSWKIIRCRHDSLLSDMEMLFFLQPQLPKGGPVFFNWKPLHTLLLSLACVRFPLLTSLTPSSPSQALSSWYHPP